MNTTPTTLWRLDTSSDPALDSILRCVIAAQGCPTARIHWFESQYIHLSRLIDFQVRKGADHVLNLVSDILELSRTEQGTRNKVLSAEPVALHAVLLAQLAQIEPLALQRGVRLMPVRGDTQAIVLADERALGQVLLNLLSNAVKYNRENGMLTVEIRSGKERVALSVSDPGRGLTPLQQQRLFRPFDRLGAEKSSTPGTGLGLVISKQLTEAMQGQLVAHAGVEGGCRFEISLPAHLPVAA